MFRPAWNNPNGFDASGSGDLTLPPPTMLTEAFVAAHTEVLCQLLQTQQQMAQPLQQMPPMQSKLQPSKPCSPEVPTQSDINAIVSATQLLEGEGPIRRTREGGSEWEPIKILLEGDESSNKTNTASNTRLRLTTQVGQAHVATGVLLN
jgi:hypothetical protein